MDLLVVEPRDVAQALHGLVLHALGPQGREGVHLHDAEVDAAQVHDVAKVLHRAAADDRQHPEVVVVEHRGEIGGDADVGAVGAAGDDAERAGIRRSGQAPRRLGGTAPRLRRRLGGGLQQRESGKSRESHRARKAADGVTMAIRSRCVHGASPLAIAASERRAAA